MNTIKIGGRTRAVEFGEDPNVFKQITEIIQETRQHQIGSVMRDLRTYVQFKYKKSLSAGQVTRLWNTLAALQLQGITNAMYRGVVSAMRANPFTCLSVEPFYTEIHRAIETELNNLQLPLALGPINETDAPMPGMYQLLPLNEALVETESPTSVMDGSQLALSLLVTD